MSKFLGVKEIKKAIEYFNVYESNSDKFCFLIGISKNKIQIKEGDEIVDVSYTKKSKQKANKKMMISKSEELL